MNHGGGVDICGVIVLLLCLTMMWCMMWFEQ